MKDNLTIKPVQFCGSELLAIQDEKGGIHAAVNPILRGLGFNERQIEYQRNKWLSDRVIAKGTQKFSGTLFGLGTGRDTWAITLKKLPFALSKIEITPSMERNAPQLAAKLEKYQDECADVLAAAFLPSPETKDYPPKSTSAGEVASLLTAVDRPMRAQRSPGYKRAAQAEKLLRHFGLPVIDNFVEPHFEQMILTTKEVTTTLTIPTK